MNRFRARALHYPERVSTPRRGASVTAKALTTLSLSSLLGRSLAVSVPQSIGDLRRYSPTRSVVAPAAFRPSAVRLVAVPPVVRARARSVPVSVGFAAPASVSICRKRRMRKEVIHAKGIAGSRVRRPRRNPWSDVIC